MQTAPRPTNDFFEEETGSQKPFPFDLKRVGYRALRYWYVIVFFLGSALLIAWYINRYTIRVYPISTSIIIREVAETSGAGDVLYKNGLTNGYRNYLNEPFIIKSYPIIKGVVEDLNFTALFYREGYLVTSEAYDYIPASVKLLAINGSYGTTFAFTILNENEYSLRIHEDESNEQAVTFRFSDSINFKGHHLRIEPIAGRSLKKYEGTPFLIKIRNPLWVTAEYVGKLQVEWALEGAGVIDLSVNGTNAPKEIDFLNGLIARYQQYDLDKKNQTADRTIKFISEQLVSISDSLSRVEFVLQRFKDKNKIANIGSQTGTILNQLQQYETERAKILIKKNYYDYLENYIQSDTNLEQVIIPSSMGIADPLLIGLVKEVADIQMDLRLFLEKERFGNPLVENSRAKLRKLKADIREALNSLRRTDKIQVDFLDKQIQTAEKDLSVFPLVERQLATIHRNYSLMEGLYIFLMQKRSEAAISRSSNVSDIIPVNPPMRRGAIAPKVERNYMIAIFIGLMIPLIIFVLIEWFNNKVQSKEDVEKFTRIPFMGGVGHNNKGHSLVVRDFPKSGISESFRALRSNLNFFTGNQSGKVIMITSSISGEGKTFTTINLATVFALSGRKTLIVGADMRRPKIYTDFGLNNLKGLSTYLSGMSTFNETLQQTQVENLYLVSGGPVPPNPSELLMTNKLREFIDEALKVFDYVLIDTPPLAFVTDAFVLSPYVDHTVFVVRQNYTPRDYLRSIQEYYTDGRLKNIGALLNDIYKTGLGYGYGYGYQYGYNYSGYGYGFRKKNRGNGYYEED